MRHFQSSRVLLCSILIFSFGAAAGSVTPPLIDTTLYEDLRNKTKIFEKEAEDFQKTYQELKGELTQRGFQQIRDRYDPLIADLKHKEQEATDRLIMALERVVSSYAKSDEVASAMLLLGSQYFAQTEAHMLQSEEMSSDKEAVADFSKTFSLYEKLIREYHSYPFLDVAYYLQGVAQLYQEQESNAVRSFEKLVTLFPQSPLKEEALFYLSDRYFETRQHEKALRGYEAIVSNESSDFYDKALYKLAWTHYVLNHFDEAIAGFTKVLDHKMSESDSENLSASSILETESLQYLAIGFADKEWDEKEVHLDEHEQGLASVLALENYFEKIGSRSYERTLFVKLGDILFKLSKYRGAQKAFERAITLDPMDIGTPELSARIIKIQDDLKNKEAALELRQKFVKDYGPSSAWARVNLEGGNAKAVFKAREMAAKNGFDEAVYLHLQAKALKNGEKSEEAKSLFERAVVAYAQYIQLFPEQSNVDEALYFLAEASFDAGWYLKAAQGFEQVRDWPMSTEYRKQAAVNLVYTFEKEIQLQQSTGALPMFELTSIQSSEKAMLAGPLPVILRQYVRSIDVLHMNHADVEEMPSFLFKAAKINYVYGQGAESARRFKKLLAEYPKLKAAAVVSDLLLFDRFKEVGEQYAKAQGLETAGQRQQAKLLFGTVGETYLALLAENAKVEYADKVLYNAGVALNKAGQFAQAGATFERLYASYPKSSLIENAMLDWAGSCESRLLFGEAALAYGRLVKNFPKSDKASKALLNAALLYEADQNFKQSAYTFEQFAERYAERPAAVLAYVRAARLYKKLHDEKNQKRLLNLLIQKYKEDFAEGDDYASKTDFLALADEFKQYQAMKINASSGKKQGNQLKDKTSRLAKLKKNYEDLIRRYGSSEWTVASVYQIGALYEGLHAALLSAPCPGDVKAIGEDACDEYQSLLEDKAFVLEEKAIEAYRLTEERSRQIPGTTAWSLKAKEALHRMKPSDYPVADQPLILPMPESVQSLLPDEAVARAELEKDLTSSAARLQMARIFYAQGKFEAARMTLQDALLSDKENAQLYLWLGHASRRLANIKEALDAYEKASSLQKNLLEAYDHAAVLLMEQGEFDKAREHLETAESMAPKNGTINAHLGDAYLSLSQNEKALHAYLQAIKLGVSGDVYFNLGLLYMTSNQLEKSVEAFQKYLEGDVPAPMRTRTEGYITSLTQKIQIEQSRKERENEKV